MDFITYTETTYDLKAKKIVNVAEWKFKSENNLLVIRRTDSASGKINTKRIFVERDSDYVYRLLKTKIKAIDGADGLVEFMRKETENSVCPCWVNKILNYSIDVIRETKI